MWWTTSLKACLILVAGAGIVGASSGDRSPPFIHCLTECTSTVCLPTPPSLSLPLRLTFWSCEDNCKYSCMHILTDRAFENELHLTTLGHSVVRQYYGKWPFYRLWGIQEPASVVFSLMNMYVHWRALKLVRRKVPDWHPMKSYYMALTSFSVNAWFWSSVFHTRDKPWTEKLDYFSAALVIFFSLHYAVIRIFHLYPRVSHGRTGVPDSNLGLTLWRVISALAYVSHVLYLSTSSPFDYSFNTLSNAVVGFTHNILWIYFSLPLLPYRLGSRPALYAILTTLATMLELFDFPPVWRVFDAHSLWHLATVPIAIGWYNFLIEDALAEHWWEWADEYALKGI